VSVRRYPSGHELSEQVAADLLELLATAQADGREPHVALTGGTIAAAIHQELGRLGPDSAVDWSRVHVWWGDERFVEPGSDDRNAKEARADFLDVVGVPSDRVHEMPSILGAMDVHAGAAAYSRAIREQGGGEFEVVMLGVGPDGHVASLFPGFPQLRADGIAVGVTGSPKPPPERITLTLQALNRSRRVWFVVSGGGKAEAVARALDEATVPTDPDRDERLPAARVQGHDETVWYVDEAAAGSLRSS
jgi:6-phosphogluconolactonase